MRVPGLALVGVLALAGCADSGSPDATAPPSPSVAVPSPSPQADVTSLLPEPPAGAAVTPQPGTAAAALTAAAEKNLAAMSMRVSMAMTVTTTGGSYNLTGTGELERPGRAHMDTMLTAIGKTFEAESVVYDGMFWTRNDKGPWKPGGAPKTANQPDAFVRYIASAKNVQDGGPATHNGHDCERYAALLNLPSLPAGALPPSLVAWVDRASGYVVGEEVVETAGAGSRTLDVTVDFQQIGVPVSVSRPQP